MERGYFSQIQLSMQPLPLMYEGWKTVGFRKTNRHSNSGLEDRKVGTELVFAKPTAVPNMGYDIRRLERGWFSQNHRPFQPWAFNIRRLERGWFSQNQPPFQPWTSRYESWNGVGFRKTNRHSNLWLKYTKVKVRRLERGWFSQIQLSIQPLPLMYEGRKTVGFRQSTSFLPCALRYESWNGVGFRKTNRHSNHRLRYTKVETGLVFAKPFAKPTAIPTMGYDIRSLERGWFPQNQPPFQAWASIYEGWKAVGFRQSNRHSNHVL